MNRRLRQLDAIFREQIVRPSHNVALEMHTPKVLNNVAQGRRASGAPWVGYKCTILTPKALYKSELVQRFQRRESLGPLTQGAPRARRPWAMMWNRVAVQMLPVVVTALLVGCHQDMYNQPRYEALEQSDFFDDGQASRPVVPGTVEYGAKPADDILFTGRNGGELATELPMELTESLLNRGQERFNIYCSVCHGGAGDGNGMIVQRGYRQPPTFHSDRLRGVPIGHFFDVMTNGFGAMPAYSLQVKPEDRWAIAAYIRALQLSQNASGDDLPDDIRTELESAPPPSKEGARGGMEDADDSNQVSEASPREEPSDKNPSPNLSPQGRGTNPTTASLQ